MSRTRRSDIQALERLGQKHMTNEGCESKIIEYFSAIDCTILIDGKAILYNKEYSKIVKGEIKNPYFRSVHGLGFNGQGRHLPTKDGIITNSYSKWSSMMARVQSKNYQKTQITYKTATVDERWHCFQNFGDWFEHSFKDHMNSSWELDKDILIKGNKIYSPETCCLVPKEINSLLLNCTNKRGKYPIGVGFDKKFKKYYAQINKKSGHSHIGYFDTPEEAFYAYKLVKETHIKGVANSWKPSLELAVYNALYNWKIEITD